MKKTLLLLPIALLTGCMTFIMPKPHDSVLFGNLVDLKILSTTITCDDKNYGWKEMLDKINHIKVYSTYRNDPQAESIKGLHEAIGKAYSSTNPVFCKSLLNVQQKRIDVIVDAWKDRK
jgi:hypothetical protein